MVGKSCTRPDALIKGDPPGSGPLHLVKGDVMTELHIGKGSSVTCRPSGDLDLVSAVSMRHLIGEVLRPGLEVVFDLQNVSFIDAVGLSPLVGSVRRVRAVGGRARISNAQPRVQSLFRLIGVDGLLMSSFLAPRNAAVSSL